jgi:hypothetical protein
MSEDILKNICTELHEINKSLQAITSSSECRCSKDDMNINQIAKELHSLMPKTFVKTA